MAAEDGRMLRASIVTTPASTRIRRIVPLLSSLSMPSTWVRSEIVPGYGDACHYWTTCLVQQSYDRSGQLLRRRKPFPQSPDTRDAGVRFQVEGDHLRCVTLSE